MNGRNWYYGSTPFFSMFNVQVSFQHIYMKLPLKYSVSCKIATNFQLLKLIPQNYIIVKNCISLNTLQYSNFTPKIGDFVVLPRQETRHPNWPLGYGFGDILCQLISYIKQLQLIMSSRYQSPKIVSQQSIIFLVSDVAFALIMQ